MSAHTEFDLGSLIWVKGEIDQALEKSRQCLAKYAAQTDAAELKFAQTHLHQVRGAVEMVGLSGAAIFAEELEVAVGAVERGEAPATVLTTVAEVTQTLTQYLESLVNGAPDIALKLLPSYRQVREARGEKHSSGADLFFPSLSADLPQNLAQRKQDETQLPRFLRGARTRFEAGFLRWIKGERREGGQWMVQSLLGVARSQQSGLQRGFWWAAAALAEGSVDNKAQLDIDQKQLFSRLNQQLKKLTESGGKVAERLFRDVLYAVAHLETQSVQCAAVRKAFGLYDLKPAGALEDDAQQLAKLQRARELKDLVNHAKDNWARVGGGSIDRLPTFRQQVVDIAKRGAMLDVDGFNTLAECLSNVVGQLTATPTEAHALEVATALLLLENCLIVYPERSQDFPAQSLAMQARLQNETNDTPDVTLLDEVSRRAQERLLMAQVAHEIQANLSQIEQTLDDFFRDDTTRGELQTTDAPIRQIRGALSMLDERNAQIILDACADIVKRCQADDYVAPADELAFLAEAFSSLGFYIDALKREETSRVSIIAPWLQKLGVDIASAPESDNEPTHAEQVAAEFDQRADSEVADAAPTPEKIVPVAPVEPPKAPAAVSEEAVDAELLEVYLEEAVEVLETVVSHIAILREKTSDRDAQTVIRRGFHTLKGSGRMVGLNQLGEVAWSVEQVMNKWLQDDKAATPSLFQLIELTAAGFSGWIAELKATGTALVEASAIFALAEQLKSGTDAELVEEPVGDAEAESVELAAEEISSVNDEVATELPSVEGLAIELPHTESAPELDAQPAALSHDLPVSPEVVDGNLDFELDFELNALDAGDASTAEPVVVSTEFSDDLVLEEGVLSVDEAPLLPGSIALINPEPPQDGADLVIGSVAISRSLFGIFLDEAYRHFATLNEAFTDFSGEGLVRPEFVHAAHTLCGIANTTGFAALGELGYAIEQALLAYQKVGSAPTQNDNDTISLSIDKVGAMLGQISRHDLPGDESQTIALLTALANRLNDDQEPAPTVDMPVVEFAASPADELVLDDVDAAALNLDLSLDAEPTIDAAPLAASLEIVADAVSHDAELPAAVDEASVDAETIELLDLSLDDELTLSLDEPATTTSSDTVIVDSVADVSAVVDIAEPLGEFELDLDEALLESPVANEAVGEDAIVVATPAEPTETISADHATVAEMAEPVGEFDLNLDDALLDTSAVIDVVVDEVAHDTQLTEPSVVSAEPDQTPHIATELSSDDVSPVSLDGIDDLNIVELEAVDLNDMDLALVDETIVVDAPELELPEAPVPVIETLVVAEAAPVIDEVPSTAGETDGVGSVAQLAHGDRLADIHVRDEIDDQLLPIFMEEMQELLPQLASDLRALRADPGASDTHDSLKRVLHTLKGSARMAGAMRMGEATHNMETRLLNAGEHIPVALIDELDLDLDAINVLQDYLINGEPAAVTAGEETLSVSQEIDGAISTPSPAATAPAQAGARVAPQAMGLSDPDAGKSTIRVRSDLVDRLVNQAGEVSISRTRIESEMLALKRSLLDLTDNVGRLRSQLREIEIQAESQMQSRLAHSSDLPDFDPLEFDRFSRLQELTRFMAESVNDVATVQHNLLKNLDESSSALTQQARMTRDLQQELMRVRMVPFSSVSERLYRLVRQTGKETSKKVNLEIRGGRAEIDRGVLEKMVSPFEHMLRNAIDHGLEKPEQRLAAGKNEFGEIVVEARQEGNELVLLLRDDGAGLDIQRIREKGIEKGLIEAKGEYSDVQIMALIFEAGFSTASAVTQLSGRGIGMDVVKSEIEDLGGRVEVSSVAGKGTTFTIHLPLTLAVTQAVLVKVAGKLFAIPSVMVEQVQELKIDPLNKLYQSHQAEWQGNVYPFHYLPRLLGDYDSQPEQKRYNTIMLLRSGASRIAVHVDELVKNQEVVVKNIGPQLVRVAGIAGATVLGNGEIVLIINPMALYQRRADAPAGDFEAAVASDAASQVEETLKIAPVVMVVDDSLTVRKITGRLLAREGYQVETAKDGVDALQKLQDIRPAVMLLDVEMPRMDGFELTRNMRANVGLRDIPIIMITSRTADKHKNYAFELGVNAFLGKPYQEDELLEEIRRLIGEEVVPA